MYRYNPLMQHVLRRTEYVLLKMLISTIELDNVNGEFFPPESTRLHEQCMRTVCENYSKLSLLSLKLLLLEQILLY